MNFNSNQIDFTHKNSNYELVFFNDYTTSFGEGEKFDIEKKVGDQYENIGRFECEKIGENKITFVDVNKNKMVISKKDVFFFQDSEYKIRERMFICSKSLPNNKDIIVLTNKKGKDFDRLIQLNSKGDILFHAV